MHKDVKILFTVGLLIVVLLASTLFVTAEKNARGKNMLSVDAITAEDGDYVNIIVIQQNARGISMAVLGSEVTSLGKIKRQLGDNTYAIKVDRATYEQIKSNSDYSVELDLPVHAFLNDSIKITNITRVQVGQLSGTNITGQGQTICVIDTGINYTHTDLGGGFGANYKVVSGWDFCGDGAGPCGTSAQDSDPMDGNGHGTHVAGIAAGNGTSLRGAAPDARIVAIRILNNSGSGFTADIISGINWCTGNATAYNISVISMSLGGGLSSSYCDSSQTSTAIAINNAIANNISVVVATGNAGETNGVSSPACITNSTRVGSTDKDDQISSFTNTGNFTILLAPGGSINSTDYRGNYSTKSGTSMATPLVAGAFALANQVYQSKFHIAPTPDNLTVTFNRSGVPITDVNNITYARIDVLAALGTLDKQAPSTTLNSPANNSQVRQGTLINISITDDFSLLSATYSRNGTTNTSTNGQISTTNWPTGNQTLTIYAKDLFDKWNVSVFQFEFTLNNIPATSNVFINPSSATRNNNLTCNYTYSDTDGDAQQANATIINWYTTGALNSTFANASKINSTNIFKLQQWACAVQTFDGFNYSNITFSANITINNIPPVTGIVYPNITTSVVSIIQLNVSATDEDGQAAIKNVSFYYTNTSNWNFIGSNATAVGQNYLLSWNTSNVGDGVGYQVRASVSDGVNTTNTTSAQTFIINNINDKPTVTVTSPNSGESWSGTKTITWTASDPDNDVITIIIYYSKDSGGNWTQIASGETNDGSYSWNTKDVSDGSKYRINITASDNALTTSDKSDADFTISNPSDSGNSGGSNSGTSGSNNIGGGGGGGLGGNQAGATYTTIVAGQVLTLDITKDLAITNIELKAKSAATNVKLTVEKFDEQPSSLSSPKGVAYKFSEIKASNLPSDAIGSVTIRFTVPKKWASDNDIDTKTIILQHYAGGWQELSTIKNSEDIDNLRFTATSPSLSFFAITGKKILGEEITIESLENKTATNTTVTPAVTGGAAASLPRINLSGFASVFSNRPYFLPNGLWVLIVALLIVVSAYTFVKRRPRTPVELFRQDIQRKYKPDIRASMGNKQQAQQFLRKMLKWMLTDTKQVKEIERQRKIKVEMEKERPDFGFR